jgi:hypothetical protein
LLVEWSGVPLAGDFSLQMSVRWKTPATAFARWATPTAFLPGERIPTISTKLDFCHSVNRRTACCVWRRSMRIREFAR